MGYVLVPSLLTDEEESKNDAFKNVWNVLRALATSDGDLEEYFRVNYKGEKNVVGEKFVQEKIFKKDRYGDGD